MMQLRGIYVLVDEQRCGKRGPKWLQFFVTMTWCIEMRLVKSTIYITSLIEWYDIIRRFVMKMRNRTIWSHWLIDFESMPRDNQENTVEPFLAFGLWHKKPAKSRSSNSQFGNVRMWSYEMKSREREVSYEATKAREINRASYEGSFRQSGC